MKKLFVITSFLALGLSSSAQCDSTAQAIFTPSTAIKFKPLSLGFGKIGLLGEYNFKHKKSVTFGIGIPLERTSPEIEIDGEKRKIKMKTFSVMGGYRMYLGKKSMSGFYFEPYLKYVKNDASTSFNFDVSGIEREFSMVSKYSGIGLGAQLGVQFLISNRVSIDLMILGPEANIANSTVDIKDLSGLPWFPGDGAEAEQEIKDALGDIPIIGDKIEVTIDESTQSGQAKFKGFAPGLRFGISFGVRF